MNAGAKLGAYGLLLVAVLGGGAAVGALAGPIDIGSSAEAHGGSHVEEPALTANLPAGGLLVSQNGYTLAPQDRLADAGDFAFTITDPDGHPTTAFDTIHDRELHLIVASRDLQHLNHLHPVRDDNGRWSVELPTMPAGPYRAFADFRPTGGTAMTLGVDLVSPGVVEAPPVLASQLSYSVDGYDISLDGGIVAGTESEVAVIVRRDGAIVTTEPYLGAAGHLVALRQGDLAYLHVHPLDGEPAGPVRFMVDVPSAGTYGLFFDFLLDGQVRTAHFVVEASGAEADDVESGHVDAEVHDGGQ